MAKNTSFGCHTKTNMIVGLTNKWLLRNRSKWLDDITSYRFQLTEILRAGTKLTFDSLTELQVISKLSKSFRIWNLNKYY